MKAKSAATFEQMLAQVHTQLQNYEFSGVIPEELARDKLIMMITDTTLKKNLLKKLLSLEELITEARSHFGAKSHTEECESLGHAAEASMHELWSGRSQARGAQNRKKSQSWGKCGHCGKSHYKGKCPAYGKTCRKCNGRNHYAACCCSDASVKSRSNKVNSVDTDLLIDNHLEEDFIEQQQCCYVITNSNHSLPSEDMVTL